MIMVQETLAERLAAGKPLRFGVVGLGVAFNGVAQTTAEWPHVTFTAACDIRQSALDTFQAQYGGETYLDFADLCRSPNVDVVYIVTPNRLHREQAIIAAEHGKHIIVDKPMAPSVADCEAMNQAAERAGVVLLCGHSHSYGPAVRAMRKVISSGELGRLRMINTWHFNEWIYRPRDSWELDADGSGNLIFNQGAHQIDIVRVLGGGMVRSVRATTGVWDPDRKTEGAYSAFLDFDDGTTATLVYNSYAHFDTAELTSWIGEGPRTPERNLEARKRLRDLAQAGGESVAKESWRYGSPTVMQIGKRNTHAHFGLTVVSCEHGDIRQSPTGLLVYGDERSWEIPVESGPGTSNGSLQNMYDVLAHGAPILRSGRWGQATTEVLEAIMESGRQRSEIMMRCQVPGVE